MALFLVSYDIAENDAWEYQPLYDQLGKLKAARILYSEWLVIGQSATSIYNALAQHVQMKDRLLVQELAAQATWDKLMISDDDFRSWLKYTRS